MRELGNRKIDAERVISVKKDDREGEGEGEKPFFHARARNFLVFVQHWSSPPEQIPPQQLRLQVSDLPHDVPHVGLLAAQLLRHRVDEARAVADPAV